MAGCTTQELWAVLSNLLEPGEVLAGAPTVMLTVVWALEVKWLMDFVTGGGGLATPVNGQVLIYTPDLYS